MSDFLSPRRHRVAASLPLDDALLVVGAGRPVPLPENSDQTYPFQSHAEYFYLTELECIDGVVAYDPREGAWLSFVPAVTEAERVWEGSAQLPGLPLAEFAPWLAARAGRPVAQLGVPRPDIPLDAALNARIRDHFHHARRPKDDHELALLRAACSATAIGYAKLPQLIRPDTSERAIQIELEAEFFRAGGTRPGYVVTIEPGLYFIPPLLQDPARRATYNDCVNWPLVDSYQHLGGVRIEDNILVTSGAPENLTAEIPKTL